MAKNNKIPKCPPLRFPEFADEWKQTTLGEILAIGNGKDYKHLSKGNIPVFGTGGYMTSVNQFLMDGESVFIGRKGTIDKPFYYNGKFWTVDTLFYTHSFVNSSPRFVLYLFSNINWLEYNEASGVPSLSKTTISKIQIFSPQIAEQQKIASFLSLIDERIESCSEIIKEIKTLKAGLLSLRVYQADKQYVPLSYFGEMKHGYPFKSTSYDEDGTHRIVTISNVSGARYADMSKCNYLAELPHDIQQHQILSRNDILISLTGNVGRVSFCLADGDLLNQRVGVLSLCDEAYKEYIYQVLSDWRFEMSMVACGQGAAQLNISKSNVEGYLVPYEQSEYQEIGNFFSLLDDRIEIEEELLKQYEMQKKYLLRQMFI